MDWWVYLIIGYAAGFGSPIAILLWVGRKQVKEALNQFKGE